MKRAFTEMSSLLRQSNCHWRGRSNGQWRGQSFAASVPSDDASKVRKGRQRVSKHERKEMLLSFVNKYRATNAGKFPTASEAQKQVGGSYYVIRSILQELQYQSTISSVNTRHNKNLGMDSGIREGYNVVVGDSGLKDVGMEEGPKSSTSFVKAMSIEDVEQRTSDECSTSEIRKQNAEGGAAGDVHQNLEKPDSGANERSCSDGVLDLDVPNTKSEQYQQSSESDKVSRALSAKKNDDQELSKKPSAWGNLKTLADGIMKLWNKW